MDGKEEINQNILCSAYNKSYQMIHGKRNGLKKLQSMGPRKVGIAAILGTHFKAITVVTHNLSEALGPS